MDELANAQKMKCSEDAVCENELIYQATFEHAPIGICHIGVDGRWLRVNKRLLEFMGYSLEEFESLTVEEISHPDDLAIQREYMNSLIQGRLPTFSMEKRYIRKDGSVAWGNLTMSLLRKPDGEPNYFIGMVENINERKHAEDLLIESEKRFRDLIFNAPLGVIVCDTEGNITTVNPSMLDILGSPSPEDTRAINVLNFPPLIESGIADSFRQCLGLRQNLVKEHIYSTKWDKEVCIRLHLTPLLNSEGKVTGIQALVEDYTERKNIEHALLQSEYILRATFEQAAVGIVHVAPDGRWLLINEKFCEIIGYTREDLTGLNFKDLIRSEDLTGDLDYLQQLVEGKSSTFTLEKRYLRKNGSFVWVQLTVSVVRGIHGELQFFIGVIQDISQRKMAEKELLRKNSLMRAELELAAKVQREILPRELPEITGIRMAWEFKPSIYVAGDMFNVFQLDERRLGFYILDVKGHGIQAALKAVTLNYLLKSTVLSVTNRDFTAKVNNRLFSPSSTLGFLNNYYIDEFDGRNYFTIFYGILNTDTLTLTYARAGHCPPIILSPNGEIRELSNGGPAIGFLESAVYNDFTVGLKTGDRLFLYTDGIVETRNEDEMFFGRKGLIDFLKLNRKMNIDDLTSGVVTQVMRHSGNEELKDDLTLLGLEVLFRSEC